MIVHPLKRKSRAMYRQWLRNGGYWADMCRTKNGKPLYRWRWVFRRGCKLEEVPDGRG